MNFTEILFYIFLFLIFYSFLGYGILLMLLTPIKRLFVANFDSINYDLPDVTLFVTAYNEIENVEQKVKNSFELDYPSDKIEFIWITDGSDDGTQEALKKFKNIKVYHIPERNGKIAAMNRGIQFVNTPIVVFSDANTLLNKDCIKIIAEQFRDEKVGCVSGEKRIIVDGESGASASGESLYWKYESYLKKIESEFNSAVGAAGELFAVRTDLLEPVEPDTLLDDFIISLRIAEKGYKIQYTPDAYAMEYASENVREELKRKIRISAGGIQSVVRLKSMLNPIKHPALTFQYISHKVLRWTLTPLLLLLIIPLNFYIASTYSFEADNFFTIFLFLQILFYLFALIGLYLDKKNIKIKLFFVPLYFFIMNYSVFLGFFRYIRGRQNVKWEKAKRAK